jgi:hypothetical protein
LLLLSIKFNVCAWIALVATGARIDAELRTDADATPRAAATELLFATAFRAEGGR